MQAHQPLLCITLVEYARAGLQAALTQELHADAMRTVLQASNTGKRLGWCHLPVVVGSGHVRSPRAACTLASTRSTSWTTPAKSAGG